MHTFSLFSGAGGLDFGLESAGFDNVGCVEMDKDARETLRINRPNWRLSKHGDIFDYRIDDLLTEMKINRKSLALLCGGPPCQPFSKAGQWASSGARRLEDPRSRTLKAYLDVLEATLPEVFLLENVKGFVAKGGSDAIHLLDKKIKYINKRNNTSYAYSIIHINAADYGIPQFRERIFVVGHREGAKLIQPPKTHCDPLTGDFSKKPWATSWDAIGHLDKRNASEELVLKGKWADLVPTIPEGENYLWHTPQGRGQPLFGWRTRYWNFLLKLAKNKPSWTLQASPGPATGPFHWKNRLLSIEELCRLQTFPEGVVIHGGYLSGRKQLGNAVPSAVAELLGLEIRRQFFDERVRRTLRLTPEKRLDSPSRTPVKEVPEKYFSLRGSHSPHPGTGLGPQPRDLSSSVI